MPLATLYKITLPPPEPPKTLPLRLEIRRKWARWAKFLKDLWVEYVLHGNNFEVRIFAVPDFRGASAHIGRTVLKRRFEYLDMAIQWGQIRSHEYAIRFACAPGAEMFEYRIKPLTEEGKTILLRFKEGREHVS